MKLMDKLERKLGKFAIHNLMMYIILGNIAVYLLCMFNSDLVLYLILDPAMVWKGQVWRLITFLFIPPSVSFTQIFLVAISLYFYYFIGRMLENRWGAFRFNVFYLIGVVCTIAMSLIFNVAGWNSYLNESLFLAFATLFPEVQVLLFFFIPIKVKWMGIITGALLIFQFITGSWSIKVMILASFLNYILFFGPVLFDKIKYGRRREQYFKKVQTGRTGGRPVASGGKIINDVAFHRCCICGKTEKDDPNMQFRYCSQCDGSREYCMDHLYDHVHYKDPNKNWTPPHGQ